MTESARQCARSALESRNLSAASWRFSQSRASRSRTPQDTTSCTSCPPRRARRRPRPHAARRPRRPRGRRVRRPLREARRRSRRICARLETECVSGVSAAWSSRVGPLEARSRGLRPRVRRRRAAARRGGRARPRRGRPVHRHVQQLLHRSRSDQRRDHFLRVSRFVRVLGNIGAAILLPILYGQPIESCIQGILFGYYCPP